MGLQCEERSVVVPPKEHGMTRPRTIGSLVLASWMLAGLAAAQDSAKPDPASVLGGPKVEDSADAPTGGSFGEPGMRQMTERT